MPLLILSRIIYRKNNIDNATIIVATENDNLPEFTISLPSVGPITFSSFIDRAIGNDPERSKRANSSASSIEKISRNFYLTCMNWFTYQRSR